MLSRRQLFVAVALLSWAAPVCPEGLGKKKKKHHHHHRHGGHHQANHTGNYSDNGTHPHHHKASVKGLKDAFHEIASKLPGGSHAKGTSNATGASNATGVQAAAARKAKALVTAISKQMNSSLPPQARTLKGRTPVKGLQDAFHEIATKLPGSSQAKGAASATPSAADKAKAAKPVVAVLGAQHHVAAGAREQHPKASHFEKGEISVGGPLPPDFEERFVKGVEQATGVAADDVRVLSVKRDQGTVDDLTFSAPSAVVEAVEDQAADPDSKLAKGILHIFLVDRSAEGSEASRGRGDSSEQSDEQESEEERPSEEAQPTNFVAGSQHSESRASGEGEEAEENPVRDTGIDINTEMPYGDLEPFGREDTAEELTDSSIKESDEMVDQLERAEVAEEKRAVFRALTRLRGAAITSFDGIARSQTGNIDEYNKRYRWRESHPLHHLADEESDTKKWAFPNGADC